MGQINVTALSLGWLSQTHWVARALVVFSLTSALMAVYYATTQQRTIGRLLDAKAIRKWIRGRHDRMNWYGNVHSCEPEDFIPPQSYPLDVKNTLLRSSFVPAITAVITMAAPQALLSISVFALLTALGVYLGFTWTRHLDPLAGYNDSRNVFIVYLVGLSVCFIVYSISSLVQDQDERSEYEIAAHNCENWMATNPETLATWGYETHLEPYYNSIRLERLGNTSD